MNDVKHQVKDILIVFTVTSMMYYHNCDIDIGRNHLKRWFEKRKVRCFTLTMSWNPLFLMVSTMCISLYIFKKSKSCYLERWTLSNLMRWGWMAFSFDKRVPKKNCFCQLSPFEWKDEIIQPINAIWEEAMDEKKSHKPIGKSVGWFSWLILIVILNFISSWGVYLPGAQKPDTNGLTPAILFSHSILSTAFYTKKTAKWR